MARTSNTLHIPWWVALMWMGWAFGMVVVAKAKQWRRQRES